MMVELAFAFRVPSFVKSAHTFRFLFELIVSEAPVRMSMDFVAAPTALMTGWLAEVERMTALRVQLGMAQPPQLDCLNQSVSVEPVQ